MSPAAPLQTALGSFCRATPARTAGHAAAPPKCVGVAKRGPCQDPISHAKAARSAGGAASDYRLLVDAVQADDLATARGAYGRMMERLSSAGTGSDDTLARIGDGLRRGDLAIVRRALNGLEGKALQVLRGLRERIDLPPPDRGGGLRLRKLN